MWTSSDALHDDRSRVCRGTTPTIDVGHFSVSPEYAASPEAPDRSQEYYALLAHGATQLMCETFHLEYTADGGIFAWADGPIYKEFSGPAIQKGDFWKIYLGRRVELDDHDSDGSLFIEGLLEDVLLFPLHSSLSDRVFERWETVEETPGIWVTRPMVEGVKDLDENNLSDDDVYEHPATAHLGLLPPAEEHNHLAEMEDEDLVEPRTNTGPVVQADPGYETSDEEATDVEEGAEEVEEDSDELEEDTEMTEDPGFSIAVDIPDREWVEGLDDVEYSDDDTDSNPESSAASYDSDDGCS